MKLEEAESTELAKLRLEFVSAFQASGLSLPDIPDPNELTPNELSNVPAEYFWSAKDDSGLYFGNNRDGTSDQCGWLFHDTLQVPDGWLESMERLKRTAELKARTSTADELAPPLATPEAMGKDGSGSTVDTTNAKGKGGSGATVDTSNVNRKPNGKRSTERNEGRAKLISALTAHHKYKNGSCLNLVFIGNNELARLAAVQKSTASEFFK